MYRVVELASVVLKFGNYELDAAGYELRRGGRPVRMERLAMELLLLLVERRGALVSRDEIAARLWGRDVFQDTGHGIHTAIRKVRQALNDSPKRPRFVQTIPGKGYRFVARLVTDDLPRISPERISIAVLPFENLTGDPNQEYLSDGLTEETIAALGNLSPGRLSVIARTSVMRYKHTRKTVGQIAGELGADYLLESALRRDEHAVRVSVRLVRARDQAQVWNERYDRDFKGAVRLQEEIGSAIAKHVQDGFAPDAAPIHRRQTTADPDAFDLYLRGKHYWNQIRPTCLHRAIDFYEQAVARDPSFALAWSGLADTYSILPVTSDHDPAELWPKARHAADEALRLQSGLAESCTSSGVVAFWLDWDWRRAEQELRRAISLNPSYVSGHRFLAHVLSNLGRHREALDVMAEARRLDPLSPVLHAVSGQLFFQARQFEDAEGEARHAITVDSEFWLGHLILGKVYERTERTAAALAEFEAAFQFSEGNTEALSLKGYVLAQMGRRREAELVLGTLLETARSRFVPPYNVAMVYAGLDDSQSAYEWLEKARLARDVHMVFFMVDPKWDQLRSRASFRSLIQRCGLPVIEEHDPRWPSRQTRILKAARS